MKRRKRSYFDISGYAERNMFYVGAILIGAIFLIVLISSYNEQKQCDATIMAKLYDTYSYIHTETDSDGNTHRKTVYGGKYEFEALGEVYRLTNDCNSSSSRTVPKELKVAYFSDDPSIHKIYTAPVWYFLGGALLVIVIIYGVGGVIFKW